MFTARQMEMLTTFANLVLEVREKVLTDYSHDGGIADIRPLADGGAGGPAYADAVATYLAFSVSRTADLNNNLCRWEPGPAKELVGHRTPLFSTKHTHCLGFCGGITFLRFFWRLDEVSLVCCNLFGSLEPNCIWSN